MRRFSSIRKIQDIIPVGEKSSLEKFDEFIRKSHSLFMIPNFDQPLIQPDLKKNQTNKAKYPEINVTSDSYS